MEKLLVFKFGGACLKNVEHIRNAANILKNFKGQKVLLVVSAIDKTTNALEKVVNSFFAGDANASRYIEEIKHQHLTLAHDLGIRDPYAINEIEDSFIDAIWLLEDEIHDAYEYVYDQVVSIGELVSSRLVVQYFKNEGLDVGWLDVRDVIKTNEDYKNATIDWESTQEGAARIITSALESTDIVVTQGFIGSTRENNTTTLGREGSDYTASVLAYCLDAASVHVWKDVEGIMTGDPKTYEHAALIRELSFDEAIEMCYFGAKVLHPKTIKPIQNKGIPLYVRPFFNVENPGTFISGKKDINYLPIVIKEEHQALVEVGERDFSFIAENHLSEIFAILSELKIKVYIMRNTAISFVFSTKDDELKLQKLEARLGASYNVQFRRNLTLLTIRHGSMDDVKKISGQSHFLFEEIYGETIQVVYQS